MVVSYADVLTGRVTPGRRVAVIGAGGIGFDTADYLVGDARAALDPEPFLRDWGVADPDARRRGDVTDPPAPAGATREITLFQRQAGRTGRGLGRSTGWILRGRLRRAGVAEVTGARYLAIDDGGLHYSVDGQARVHACDTVILCAGQESDRGLHQALATRGVKAHLVGGADDAEGLDAVRAIDQATRLAVTL